MRTLEGVLRDEYGLGDAIEGWTLSAGPQGIANFSDDGFVMAGRGLNPRGASQVWVADLRTLAEWSSSGGGIWHATGNWSGSKIPHNNVGTARLWSSLTADGAVDLGGTNTVVRSISFKNEVASYNVGASAGGHLVLESRPGTASIVYEEGNLKDHSISTPITLASNTLIDIPPADRRLTITGAIDGAGFKLTKKGAGFVSVPNVRVGALELNGGTFQIQPNGTPAGTSLIGALSIAGETSPPSSKLDLTNNALVIDYTGASPAETVRQQIVTGRGGTQLYAPWTGQGITSNTVATDNVAEPESRSIGYAENGSLPLGAYTAFRGQPVDETSLLIAYTRTGDANLDGLVNDEDVTIVSASYAPGVPNSAWALGDFDYNGFVDDDDVTLLSAFYDPSAPPLIQSAPPEGVAAIPEPASWILSISSLVALSCYRIRRCLLLRSKRTT